MLIALIAPFSFATLSITYRLLFALAIGFASSISVVLVVITFRKVLPNYMQEDNWTVGKEVTLYISVVLAICVLIFLFFVVFNLSTTPLSALFGKVVLFTGAISIFPIIIQVLYEQYRFQKRSAVEALALTKNLGSNSKVPSGADDEAKSIRFEAENGKVELQLATDQICYLKADGNYVEVFYLNRDKVEKKLIRNRLKVFAEQLPGQLFFHCHKSYIVNGKQILSVEGNARNFELTLRAVSFGVPVSRSKSEELSRFLKSL
ncbi:MAG: LytTR family DNA-binding domain-containing protein [Bacteroidota bacterium]